MCTLTGALGQGFTTCSLLTKTADHTVVTVNSILVFWSNSSLLTKIEQTWPNPDITLTLLYKQIKNTNNIYVRLRSVLSFPCSHEVMSKQGESRFSENCKPYPSESILEFFLSQHL